MARQSNSDKLNRYRGKVEASRKWRQNEQYDNLWTRLINLYRGKHYRGNIPGDRLLVNICFSTINTLAPAVSIGRPKILVNPRRPEDGDKAILTEAIINYWWQHYGCQPEFQRSVKDSLIIGHGWVKTGYRFVEEKKLDDIEETADEAAESIPTGQVESVMVIREDRPFLERVDPFDMFVDPDATSMSDVRWIAQRSRRPLKDVQNDNRYDYAARKEVSASSYSKWGNTNSGSNNYVNNTYTDDEAYCDIYEYYDINAGTMSIFSDSGGDKFLVKPVKIPYVFGHPFVMLRDYDIPNYFYPMGELEAIEPLQMELNETRTQMMNHRKRYSRKWLFSESAFDDFGRNALVSDDDNVIVPVKGNENLNNVIVPMPAVINPPEFYNQSSLITNDIDRVSGISEYQRGAIPETTRTAREASIIAESSNARVAEKLIGIENSIAACAENLIKLAQQFMTEEQTIRVIGSENAPVWLKFDKDYINGEFDFTVEAGSTAPRNEAFRRDMALQMVSAMQPFAAAGIVNMEKLAEYVLGTGFGVKNPESFLTAPPPQAMEGPGGQPMGPGGPEGMPPMGPEGIPGLTPEMMAQVESEMGMAPQGGAPQGMAPQGQMAPPSEEELMAILEALQSGELTIEDLPPEIAQMLEEMLAAQQDAGPEMAPPMGPGMGQAMAPEGEIPQEILTILEALQSGEITPEQIPPELMEQILPFLEGGM
jgi:hypothetical protein